MKSLIAKLTLILLLTSCATTKQDCSGLNDYLVDAYDSCMGHIDSSPSECVESSKELLCKIELTVEG